MKMTDLLKKLDEAEQETILAEQKIIAEQAQTRAKRLAFVKSYKKDIARIIKLGTKMVMAKDPRVNKFYDKHEADGISHRLGFATKYYAGRKLGSEDFLELYGGGCCGEWTLFVKADGTVDYEGRLDEWGLGRLVEQLPSFITEVYDFIEKL